eukprot:3527469-Rhodomonas_salina.1
MQYNRTAQNNPMLMLVYVCVCVCARISGAKQPDAASGAPCVAAAPPPKPSERRTDAPQLPHWLLGARGRVHPSASRRSTLSTLSRHMLKCSCMP